MPFYDLYDVFCFEGTDFSVNDTINFGDSQLLDPVTIEADDYFGNPYLGTNTEIGGGNFDGMFFYGMDVTYSDGSTGTAGAQVISTDDGNTYLIFPDGMGDFEISSAVVTSVSRPREPILNGVSQDNDQTGSNPPCFTPRSIIMTKSGPKPIHRLRQGDLVQTRDNGFQPVKWIYSRRVSAEWMTAEPGLLPVVIRKGALGPNMPDRDMNVSPGHLMLVKDIQDEKSGVEEFFVPARQMLNRDGVFRSAPCDTGYVHLLFDTHQVVLVDGAWSESFQPSIGQLSVIGEEARDDLFRIFPEMGKYEGLAAYQTARQVKYRSEGRSLIEKLSGFETIQ